jgi:hypothetical protein
VISLPVLCLTVTTVSPAKCMTERGAASTESSLLKQKAGSASCGKRGCRKVFPNRKAWVKCTKVNFDLPYTVSLFLKMSIVKKRGRVSKILARNSTT